MPYSPGVRIRNVSLGIEGNGEGWANVSMINENLVKLRIWYEIDTETRLQNDKCWFSWNCLKSGKSTSLNLANNIDLKIFWSLLHRSKIQIKIIIVLKYLYRLYEVIFNGKLAFCESKDKKSTKDIWIIWIWRGGNDNQNKLNSEVWINHYPLWVDFAWAY